MDFILIFWRWRKIILPNYWISRWEQSSLQFELPLLPTAAFHHVCALERFQLFCTKTFLVGWARPWWEKWYNEGQMIFMRRWKTDWKKAFALDSVLSLKDRLPIEERPDELDNVRFRIIRWEMEQFEFEWFNKMKANHQSWDSCSTSPKKHKTRTLNTL